MLPNTYVYTEHLADLPVALEKPSLVVSIWKLIFLAWRFRNIFLHDQGLLDLMGQLFISLLNCRSFYLEEFLLFLSEPIGSFLKWIGIIFIFL